MQPADRRHVLAEAAGSMLDQAEVAAGFGGAEVTEACPAAPFDHLVFTGRTAVAVVACR